MRCRVPHYYRRGEPLTGLTSLESLLYGPRLQAPKVVVVVWNLTVVTRPKGQICRVEIDVLDTSSRVKLNMINVSASSFLDWTAGRTVLLLSVPQVPLGVQEPLRIGRETLIHVDPDIEEAKALKEFASEQMGKQIVKGGKFLSDRDMIPRHKPSAPERP